MKMEGNVSLLAISTAPVLFSFLKLPSLIFPPSSPTSPTSGLEAVPTGRESDSGHPASPWPQAEGPGADHFIIPRSHSLPLVPGTIVGLPCISVGPASHPCTPLISALVPAQEHCSGAEVLPHFSGHLDP